MQNIIFLLTFILLSLIGIGQNKANDILGNYMPIGKPIVIQISESKGKYYGKIILNRDPALLDANNPEKEKQKRKILGLTILSGLTFDGNNTWENGIVYNPNNGKTYQCKITINKNGNLNIRGFIGFSLLGRSETFIKIKN